MYIVMIMMCGRVMYHNAVNRSMISAQRLSRRSIHYVSLLQEQINIAAPSFTTQIHARGFTTSKKSSNNDATPPTDPINHVLSIIKTFNIGLQKLKSDFFTSLHIREAEQTRSFLQRKIRLQYEQRRKKMRLHEKHGIHIVVQEGEKKREMAFIPSNVHSLAATSKDENDVLYPEQKFYVSSNYLSSRRPQEQLRQISRDLQVTLPTVAAFVFIPFVGYSFLLLGMMFPRLLLSRQFHTKKQRWHFATEEFGERRGYFDRLNADFWGYCMRSMPGLTLLKDGDTTEKKKITRQDPIPEFIEPLTYYEMDAGGPVLTESSIHLLYQLLAQGGHKATAVSTLQNTHIHSLALANNLAAPLFLPSTLSPLFLQTCIPSRYLNGKLTTLAEDIIMDDSSLIEEGHIDVKCSGMSEEEVLDACWMRGLPVGRFATPSGSKKLDSSREEDIQMMRMILTNHLEMMQFAHGAVGNDAVMHSRSELVRDEALQLL